MQQTEKYQLNLIETTDVFSPNPLNENTQKLETALSAADARLTAAADAEAQARAALDQRVAILEGLKAYLGYYKGDGNGIQHVSLGFTPSAVLIMDSISSNPLRLVTADYHLAGSSDIYFEIEEGGFWAATNRNGGMNTSGKKYWFIAFP